MAIDLDKFISKSPTKTPASMVYVYDNEIDLKIRDWFTAPAGFQLERYVMYLYPDDTIVMEFNEDKNLEIRVKDSKGVKAYFLKV